MHDPMTVAFKIKSPFRTRYGPNKEHVTRNTWVTIWHVDPERNGSDDSCDWFGGRKMTEKQKATLDKIASTFAFEWHRNEPYERFGWFMENGHTDANGVRHYGEPNYSSHAIVLAMFRIAANEHFGHWSKRADRFLSRNLFDILHFAENSCDSLDDSIQQKYGLRDGDRKKQARRFAHVVYSWILRKERPWWKHPRWHVHHWHLQVHPLQSLRRWLFTRCARCGKRFKRGESVTGFGWGSPPRRWLEWFRSERDCYHGECANQHVAAAVQQRT